MNRNIKCLFKNIIYNGKIVGIKASQREITYKIGDSTVRISFYKKVDENVEIPPIKMEDLSKLGFHCCTEWTVLTPLHGNLPIYTYELCTEVRTYTINDLTLTEQEEIANQIDKSLKDFEIEHLQKLMDESLK